MFSGQVAIAANRSVWGPAISRGKSTRARSPGSPEKPGAYTGAAGASTRRGRPPAYGTTVTWLNPALSREALEPELTAKPVVTFVGRVILALFTLVQVIPSPLR